MPTAPAQRCANVANENKWTYDENRVLLGAIEQFSNGKIVWDVVGKVMKDAGFERTGKMCRHRYGRIVKGQTRPGVNRCNICGQRRKGHTCMRVGQWFKRLPSDFPIPFEVWEVFVMPHMVTRDYQPPQA